MNSSRSAWVLGLILSGVVLGGCGGAQSRLDSHLKRGQEYYDKGDYAKASVELRNALQIAPKDTKALLLAAQTTEKLGRPRDAAAVYQNIVDSSPDNAEARGRLGRLLVLGNQPEIALPILQAGLKDHPDDVRLLTWAAAAKQETNDLAGAVSDSAHALQVDPSSTDAIALRAGLYQKAGDLTGAINLVSAALARQPKSVELHQVLTNLYISGSEPEKAEEQLRAVIALKPDEVGYRNELALFYARQHKLDDAQHVLEDNVKRYPHSDDVKLTLANFVVAQRGAAQGEQLLKDFVARDLDDMSLRLNLGLLQQRLGKVKEAQATYADIIERDDTKPSGLMARDRLAQIAYDQGRYADAKKLIGEVLDKDVRNNEALLVRGRLALLRNDFSGAIADFRAVLRDQPKAVPVQRLLAQALGSSNQTSLAEETLRSAMDTAPEDVSVRTDLAKLLLQTQRADAAVSLMEEAVRKYPKDVTARDTLTRAYLMKKDFANARTAATGIQTLRPDLAVGWYLAGLAAQADNHLDEAQQDYQLALQKQANAFDALSALVRIHVARGHLDDAIALVSQTTAKYPEDALAANLLGELHLKANNLPKAVEALNQAIKDAPQWWVPQRNLAVTKFALQDGAGAEAAYRAAIKVAPEEMQLVSELALLYQQQGRFNDAIACYEDWHRTHPQDVRGTNNLAMLLVTHKSDQASLDRARDLTAPFASSQDPSLLDTNGWVHFKRAEYPQALTSLQRAAERNTASKEIHYHLGMAELQGGNKQRARTELETALSGASKFAGADEARTALASLKNSAI
jgi:tetratricopeptide (TPR) repeat protein